jgi:voltage-gated potassium channel
VYFLQGDYTKLNVLRDAGLAYARTAILLADKTKPRSDQDRDARTVLAAMLIERDRKKIGGDIFTCVELLNPDNKEQLKALDVEEVVSLDDYGGSIIAASSANEGLVTVFNELFTRGWGNAFIKRPVYTDLIEKNVIEAIAWLKENKDALLLAVERSVDGRRKPIVNPDGDFRLQKGDALVLIATDENTK